jgi:hypothetical protein
METLTERVERIERYRALDELNADFCRFLDHNMVDELAELFCEDADYSHGERVSSGRAEIHALFSRRTAGGPRTSRHMQTGLRITEMSCHSAKVYSVCMTFAVDGVPPITSADPFLVADFIDEYRLCGDDRWRIAKRHIKRIFTAPSNRGPVGLEPRSR